MSTELVDPDVVANDSSDADDSSGCSDLEKSSAWRDYRAGLKALEEREKNITPRGESDSNDDCEDVMNDAFLDPDDNYKANLEIERQFKSTESIVARSTSPPGAKKEDGPSCKSPPVAVPSPFPTPSVTPPAVSPVFSGLSDPAATRLLMQRFSDFGTPKRDDSSLASRVDELEKLVQALTNRLVILEAVVAARFTD